MTMVMERKQGFAREWNTVIAVMARDILLVLKSPSSLIFSLIMPITMMGMVGGNLMQNMSSSLSFDFGGFMLVGMLVNMLFMTTSTNMTSLVEDRGTDFTQEMLISPVSRYSIILGKIFGSMFSAVVSLVGTLLVGLCMGIVLPLSQLLWILLLSPPMCVVSGAFAMLFIGLMKSTKAANMLVSLLTMSQMFLSGAIIPINHSSGVLFFLSRCMPMTYCIDLVRAIVYAGTQEYNSVVMLNPMINLTVILVLTVTCLIIGTVFFARSEKNK